MRYFVKLEIDSGVFKFSRSLGEILDQDVAASSNSSEMGLFCNLCIQVLVQKILSFYI